MYLFIWLDSSQICIEMIYLHEFRYFFVFLLFINFASLRFNIHKFPNISLLIQFVMKKLIIVALIVLNAMFASARLTSLNDGWFFGQDSFGDLKAVNLPHSWNSDAYFTKDYSKGKFYYRRYLNLLPSDSSRNFYLRLEGASKSSEVSVNGKPAGHHEGGYTESIYNLTPFLSFLEPNLIEISVNNSGDDIPPISGDFTFFGGIYRDVWLEVYWKWLINSVFSCGRKFRLSILYPTILNMRETLKSI